jgi:hypothetical protein
MISCADRKDAQTLPAILPEASSAARCSVSCSIGLNGRSAFSGSALPWPSGAF